MKFNTDVFFIILFVIIISIIVGLNIVSVIDKKISNVAVNVPPIDIPKPTVIVKINNCDDKKKLNKSNEHTENFNTVSKNNDTVINVDIDNNNDNNNDNIDKEHFDDLTKSKTSPSNNDKINKINKFNKIKGVESMTNLMPYNEALKKNSPHVKKNKKAYISSADYGWTAPRQTVACANGSIAQKWKGGKKSLMPFQISCNQSNLLTAENYYKTHYKIPIIPMEDNDIRGANYYEFSDYPEPHAVDFRILSQSTKGVHASDTKLKNIPNGQNYGFHNTPAMRMP